MRTALSRLKELYSTPVGQDVIETLLGAGTAAGYQALFTDLTPEEIALSTVGGIGAAAVGRPLLGRAGQYIGNRYAAKNPRADAVIKLGIQDMIARQPAATKGALAAKFAAFDNLSGPAQLGQVFGRMYGDNVAQGAFALASPLFMGGEEDA